MKTRILFLIALLLGVLLFACAAAEKIGDYEYELNPDGTATITAYIGQPVEELEVPAELVKKTKKSGETRITVTAIGDGAFREQKKLTRVVISEGITDIGDSAFSGCANLAEVIIPEGVVSIGNYAFSRCGMTSIRLPDSVTEIGRNPFDDCFSLKEIHVTPDAKGLAVIDGVLFSKADKRLVCYPGGLEYEEYAIPNGIQIIDGDAFPGIEEKYDSTYDVFMPVYHGPSSLFIPESITEIEDDTFRHDKKLTQVIIQEGVTGIGSYAFAGTGLISIEIPKSVTSIGEGAFAGCNNLVSVSIPESVTVIEHGTFSFCTELKSITLPRRLKRIGLQEYNRYSPSVAFVSDGAFAGCTNLTSIIIPDGVEVIGEYTFNRCTSLTSVSIPPSVTRIGAGAFCGCEGLTEIVIPDSVTVIGESAFACCSGLTSVVIPDNITEIADGLFAAVTNVDLKYSERPEIRSSLTSVIMGDGVTRIGHSAFFRCDKLTEIVIPDSVTSIGNIAFQGCSSLKSIRIPAGVTEIGLTAFFNMNYKPNTDILIIVDRDSYAAQYCKELGLNYTYPDALDWLNN